MYRGRALLAPCLLTAIWVLARSAAVQDIGPEVLIHDEAMDGYAAENIEPIDRRGEEMTRWPSIENTAAKPHSSKRVSEIIANIHQFVVGGRPRQKMPPPANRSALIRTLESLQDNRKAESAPPASEPFNRDVQAHKLAKGAPARPNKSASRISLYGYAFWRDEGRQGLAPLAQYGGSQLGLVASYRLGTATTAPALFARASGELDTFQGAEAAAGVRWQPTRKIPISLAVERRFRHKSDDAVAAYLFGGWSSDRLPVGAELSVYGQAGVVRADRGPQKIDHFYDGQIRLERRVLTAGKVHLTAGGGVWAGGQSGINRVDTGPTAAVNFGLGQTSFRLSADYRVRMTGNAAPPSGPAITLSASY